MCKELQNSRFFAHAESSLTFNLALFTDQLPHDVSYTTSPAETILSQVGESKVGIHSKIHG